MISLSQKESDGDDVLMIGIWGPGGIGKTAIARAIYNAIKRQFQGSCFLERVRETSNKSNGLVDLQRRLLSQILSSGHLLVPNVHDGISLIRDRLPCKKVLLVLDDVDQLDQLDVLAGEGHWFGKGSRIFVTSRDKRLFTLSRCKNRLYEVKPLDHDEALDLFNQHAFSNCKKHEIRKDLIGRALHYAGGFPLALEVLGSFLCGREEPAWESALHNLSKCPDQTINKVLKISFEGLENNEKEVFLDIACFFKGKNIEYIKKVIDNSRDFDTTIVIDILIERSLIRNEHGTLQMHDLVQLMGQNIVLQDNPGNPGQRSRLWFFKDVLDVLCEEKGTDAIEAIVVDFLTPEERDLSLEEITIEADAFKKMTNLRMLIFPKAHISSDGPIHLPSNLRWLKWPNAPLPKFGSGPKELIGLDLQKSHIRQLNIFKHFRWLKYVNFSQCKSLVSVPDFSSAPNLEFLNLDWCESLVELHQSVACLDKLELLSLQYCFNLSIFPHTLKAKSLQTLDLFCCCKLKKFSDIPEKMEHLEELDLGWTAIKELPASIENLSSVKLLNLEYCKRLTTLPSSVYKLQNLLYLNLDCCSNFAVFPRNSTDPSGNPGFRNLYWLEFGGCNLSEVEFLESSSSFPKLAHLNLSRNKFTHLPTCINKYDNLEHLIVDNCKQLQKIPQLPPNVHTLKELPKMRSADILLTGREMPEWFFHCKDGSISFMVPRDLYDKFLGLALCLVHGPEEGNPSFGIYISVNGRGVFGVTRSFSSMKSDHMWILYLPRSELYQMYKEKELQQDDRNHFQVYLYVPEGRLKKCGFRLICEQEEDDMRIELQHHQPMETNSSLEERDSEEDNWIDTEEEESSRERYSSWARGGTCRCGIDIYTQYVTRYETARRNNEYIYSNFITYFITSFVYIYILTSQVLEIFKIDPVRVGIACRNSGLACRREVGFFDTC
ncbi:hypothetical protein EUGRSUZ_H01423 [Eucalyptus grandis]|uniref:Uncharacterized protein n=2 Tax=Eucalyptus grandis TaxID=71139 RepID=A0ACC3JQ67_EUCGR|nr:hypothetical protein EUGRSUZ_H01423 [Eucalyptus grandis]